MKPRFIQLFGYLLIATITTSAGTTNTPTATALAELTKPTKKIPFKEVILATTNHRIVDFDTNNVAHRELFQKISTAATIALTNARTAGLFSTRANEAGNHMEAFVRAAFKTVGLNARAPITTAGAAVAATGTIGTTENNTRSPSSSPDE
jgi:hypothetical protein